MSDFSSHTETIDLSNFVSAIENVNLVYKELLTSNALSKVIESVNLTSKMLKTGTFLKTFEIAANLQSYDFSKTFAAANRISEIVQTSASLMVSEHICEMYRTIFASTELISHAIEALQSNSRFTETIASLAEITQTFALGCTTPVTDIAESTPSDIDDTQTAYIDETLEIVASDDVLSENISELCEGWITACHDNHKHTLKDELSKFRDLPLHEKILFFIALITFWAQIVNPFAEKAIQAGKEITQVVMTEVDEAIDSAQDYTNESQPCDDSGQQQPN